MGKLNHIGIIIDGNRRWSRKNGLDVWEGHKAGADKVEEVLDWCLEANIPEVSIYTLSTENFEKRSKKELGWIFKILLEKFRKLLNDERIYKYDVKVRLCGDYYKLPNGLVDVMLKLMRRTARHHKKTLNILINYGSQWEITNIIAKIANNFLIKGKRVQITPKIIQENLDVKRPLDLIIRTGGEHRLSNFLMFQASYSEIFFTDTLWPDFSKKEFLKIVKWFKQRKRRFGK